MVDLPPHLLRSFVAVADAQSYTRGGLTLRLAQPTVHQHVRQLERLAGERLVEQVGKKVVVTAPGRIVYEHALRVANEAEDLSRALNETRSPNTGQIAISAATTAGEFVVPGICVGFRTRFPGVQLSISVINDAEAVDGGVASRQFEIGFHSDGRDNESLIKAPVLEESLVAIAPPGHPLLRRSRPLRPGDFADEPFVLFGANVPGASARGGRSAIRSLIETWFERERVIPQVVLSCTSIEAIKTAVRAGAGLSIVSRASVRMDDSSLSVLELADPPSRSFFLVRRRGGWESAANRAFVEFALSGAWRTPE